MNDVVEEWQEYEAGVNYHNQLQIGEKSYYEMIDTNIAFSSGDQWRNVKAEDISKPMIPIIPKAKQFVIANVTSTDISANINPTEFSETDQTPEMLEEIEATDMANAEIRNLFDELKYEFKVREGLGDAYDMGDMCMHFYWDNRQKPFKGPKYEAFNGKICCELVDAPNILFGNPNNPNPQKQPYIMVMGRDLASTLTKEAKQYKKSTKVETDTDNLYQASDNAKVELDIDKYGKALFGIKYYKDGDTIRATKFVKNAYIYKDVDLGITKYPIAWMNYYKQKNQYHGRAAVTGLIPNQIAVNKLLAMVIYSVMKNSFPTLFYNAERMTTPTNEIGKAIPLRNMQPGESVGNLWQYGQISQPAAMVIDVINLIINYTKEMMGITDAAVGNVTPENTSAIALAEKLTSVPLENVRSNLYEFTEQVVDILLDFIGNKYGIRPIKLNKDGNRNIVMYDFSKINELNYNKTIDVGAIGYSSELTSLKELRDLLELGAITAVDYLKRLPENTIPNRDELVKEIEFRMGLVSEQQAKENAGKWEQMAAFMETLPIETQNELKKLPDNELEQALTELMAQAPQQEEVAANANLNQAIGGIVQ